MTPKPTSVRYNDWRQAAVEPLDTFTPTLPVSVIIPYYQTPAETLTRTLAALETQTYPRDLFEVVIVDDGSEPPLSRPRSTPLDLRVVCQERRGFGLARARNTGARAAAYGILLFLDSDMLVEADWMAAHARWHHFVSDSLTLGLHTRVSMDGIHADTIRRWTGSLEKLLSAQPADPPWVEDNMIRTNHLDSRGDDLFRAMCGGNFGIGKDFYWSTGGHDESFARWGAEDTEFCYRAFTRGGLLVPAQDALAWHQGRWDEDRAVKEQSEQRQRGKVAHLIAHPAFRGNSPGRIFTVPQYVVTMDTGDCPPDQVVRAVVDILADRVHDLVVRIEMPADDDGPRLQYLREVLEPDPRVRLTPAGSALDDFPASPFHVTIPAGVGFARGLVHRLRARLGDAVTAISSLPDGSAVSITRAWALHRARRAGGSPADFGEARTIPAAKLKLKPTKPAAGADSGKPMGYPTNWDSLLNRARDTRSPGEAWSLLKWLAGVAWKRAAVKRRVAWWRLQSSMQSRWIRAKAPRMTDTPGESVPAFDLRAYNPIGWQRDIGSEVAALGPIEWLPPGVEAIRTVHRRNLRRLRRVHHLEDAQAFHADDVTRAGELARLAAAGVVVHLADGDERLRRLLGDELYGLMTTDMRSMDAGEREQLSIRMRRAALRDHSSWARARRLAPENLPSVSILLVTKRPRFLAWALDSVARQTYSRLELVLALHGEGFADVERRVAELPHPVKVLQVPESEPLGAALNTAAEASSGTLLTKMDDDDVYGADHVWDLVLAREYSGAHLVGKWLEFVYLVALDRTIHRVNGGSERYQTSALAGGTLLISRSDLDRAGGWRKEPGGVDTALAEDILRAGGRLYRTHGAGFMLVRHGQRHTWDMSDDFFLAQAYRVIPGWNPALAGIEDLALPHPAFAYDPLPDLR